MKLRHNFHDCQRFLQSHIQNFLFFKMDTRPFICWPRTENICQMLSHIVHFGVKHSKLSAVFESHILPQMKRMQRDWSRGVILSMSRRQDRFKVHQRWSQNPKHWSKNMPLYPGPVSWSQSLCGRTDVKPSVRCLSCQRHPDQPLDAKEPLHLWRKHLLVFLFLLWLLCLSLTLSLSHTSNTCAHKQVHTQGKVTFPVLLRPYDSYFRVVTCSAERRGRCKGDTKSRWKRQQIAVLFLKKRQICV